MEFKDDVMSLRCTDVDGVIVINDLVMQVGREHYEQAFDVDAIVGEHAWEDEQHSLDSDVPSGDPLSMFIDSFGRIVRANNEFQVAKFLGMLLIMRDGMLSFQDMVEVNGSASDEV